MDFSLTQPQKPDYRRVVHPLLESDSTPRTQDWISVTWGLEIRPTFGVGGISPTYNLTTSHITGCSKADFWACRIPIPHSSNLYKSHIIINQGRSHFKPLIHLNHYTDLSIGVHGSTPPPLDIIDVMDSQPLVEPSFPQFTNIVISSPFVA